MLAFQTRLANVLFGLAAKSGGFELLVTLKEIHLMHDRQIACLGKYPLRYVSCSVADVQQAILFQGWG